LYWLPDSTLLLIHPSNRLPQRRGKGRAYPLTSPSANNWPSVDYRELQLRTGKKQGTGDEGSYLEAAGLPHAVRAAA
jgi:hypothetical protein